MTIPLWGLLAFAAWTLIILVTTHGTYRWARILTKRARLDDFAAYRVEGEKGWYTRGMRAHANCVENLPVYGALVVVITAAELESPALNGLAIAVIAARIPHSLVHILFEQTNTVVAFRSLFFNIQWLAMGAMATLIALSV